MLEVKGLITEKSAGWRCGGNMRYKEYPGVDHNCWTPTYADKDVLKWFFDQRGL